MAEFEIPRTGQPCWFELATPDADKCKEFYSEILGWKLVQSQLTTLNYSEIHTDGQAVGGILQMTDEWKMPETDELMPSHWMTYIAVDDVDATAEKAKSLGATICVEPVDVPNIGRFSIINDPTGAIFTIIRFVQT
jgi:predicted enzyme related to lactoylglutathione lyase